MFNVTRLIHADELDRDRLANDLLRATAGARVALVAPTLPGSRNGGDLLAHLRFDDESHWESIEPDVAQVLADPAIGHVDGVTYRGKPAVDGTRGTVYRTLLLRVLPETEESVIAHFEDDLRLLTRYVSSITAWQLSRVESAVGASPWTHVFEQEFIDAHGLMGPYLMHPIHWAYVDRWFDPESPEVIIRDRVCHSFCSITTPALI